MVKALSQASMATHLLNHLQVALITGADSGIGRAVAVAYAREGRLEDLAEHCFELATAYPPSRYTVHRAALCMAVDCTHLLLFQS